MTVNLKQLPLLHAVSWNVLPTSISMSLVDLLALLDIDKEECPLVVVPPTHSSQVVVGGTIPTITVSSSVAETTLSASPRSTPRISTSSANMTGGDVWGVIQQCPSTSPNMALIGTGVG